MDVEITVPATICSDESWSYDAGPRTLRNSGQSQSLSHITPFPRVEIPNQTHWLHAKPASCIQVPKNNIFGGSCKAVTTWECRALRDHNLFKICTFTPLTVSAFTATKPAVTVCNGTHDGYFHNTSCRGSVPTWSADVKHQFNGTTLHTLDICSSPHHQLISCTSNP
jgi:hypothetical protein